MDPTQADPKANNGNEENWLCGHPKTGPVWCASNPQLLGPQVGIQISQCQSLNLDGSVCGKIIGLDLIQPIIQQRPTDIKLVG